MVKGTILEEKNRSKMKEDSCQRLPLTPVPLSYLFLPHGTEKDQNCKLQFPQADYFLRNSPDFRTVFGIMIGPFSFCEIR